MHNPFPPTPSSPPSSPSQPVAAPRDARASEIPASPAIIRPVTLVATSPKRFRPRSAPSAHVSRRDIHFASRHRHPLDLRPPVLLPSSGRSSRTFVSHNPPFPWYPPAVDTPSLLSLNLVDLAPGRSTTTCCSCRPPASEAKNPCGGEREALRTCYPVHPAAAANMVCQALPGPCRTPRVARLADGCSSWI
jgi:hypothetical protein